MDHEVGTEQEEVRASLRSRNIESPEFVAPQHLYGYLGIKSHVTGRLTAEAEMPVTPDVVTPGGLRAALMALLIEGSFGQNILQAGLFPVLDNMTVHVRDAGLGVRAVRSKGELVRLGSSRAIARGRVEEEGNPSHLLAYATIGYWMIKPSGEYMTGNGPAAQPSDVRDLSAPRPSVLEAMGMKMRASEPVCELRGVHTGVMAPEGRLHGGAHQLMHEASALAAATAMLGTDRLRVGDLSIRFVAPAMKGPFVATGSVLSSGPDDVLCEVVLIDHGVNEDLRSVSTTRILRVAD